ncbi:MAG: RnfABCDGE type electron transport complex subunit B [Acidobacteriota bacterium]|nr:RnfABCDGE type electron transport complex subunit B [Acidobacteriota bacterium]
MTQTIILAGGIMLGIGAFFGTLLALADRFLKVYEDPRIDALEEMLPGTNCGACGQPGCRGFAVSLVAEESAPGQCTVSSPEGIETVASFLGVEAGFQEKVVARLHCAGGTSAVKQLADYHGMSSCRAAFVVNGGGKACPWGCLGLGDCDRACDFDAIHMNDESLPVVSVEKCTACNDCVEICPLDLFALHPVSDKAIVQCSSPLTGDAARAICRVTCDGCGLCAADAEPGAIEMTGGLPVINNPQGARKDCTLRCPTEAIRWVEGDQFDSETDRHA